MTCFAKKLEQALLTETRVKTQAVTPHMLSHPETYFSLFLGVHTE
jgi:hypothetical protein